MATSQRWSSALREVMVNWPGVAAFSLARSALTAGSTPTYSLFRYSSW
jgi:hypothetical protein